MPDPLDLDALDRQHHEGFVHGPGGGDLCLGCWLPWPCPTSTLIRRVRDLEQQVAEADELIGLGRAMAVRVEGSAARRTVAENTVALMDEYFARYPGEPT